MAASAPAILGLAICVQIAITVAGTGIAWAASCPVGHDKLLQTLKASVKPTGGPSNGGLDNNEWAAVVTRDGTICAVAYSGNAVGDQWPASRGIAAEKANTANGVSLDGVAVSTANLYAQSQPGGYLYGTSATNPPNPAVLYAGDPASFGSATDPMMGKALGGVVAFGGGLALYDDKGVVGGLGVSGDTPCADHNVAWRTRKALGLDKVRSGLNHQKNDAILYDIGPNGKSTSGFGHPICGGQEPDIAQQIGAGSGHGG
jgi:uncharacterized protein GlcG (DUF336 family)